MQTLGEVLIWASGHQRIWVPSGLAASVGLLCLAIYLYMVAIGDD